MNYRKLRVVWSVALAAIGVLLLSACIALQYRGNTLELVPLGGPALPGIGVYSGRLLLSWEPRVPYRPEWAGQTNHYGFRYNMYSSGSWNVSAPVWVAGVLPAAAAALFATLPWLHYSFSLRTLLIATALVAVGLGTVAILLT